MSGGTNREVTFVTQSDINVAKSDLSKEALSEATADFNKKIENLRVIEESKKQETVSATANPSVNSEASDFTMTVKVSVRALAFNSDDVSKLIKADIEKEYGYSKQVVDDGSKEAEVEIVSSNLATGKFTGMAKTNAYVANKLDEKQIKDELKGTNSTKAENYLKGLENVKDVKLQFWPPFPKIFPRIKSHIYLSIQVAEKSD
jgi:outer membrane lipopolysaccharide assembly protein LptE/RlpB